MLPPGLRDLTAFLQEFNELQLELLQRVCCDGERGHPLLRDLVVYFVAEEQARRYRRAALPGEFMRHAAAGLTPEASATAAATALRLAAAVSQHRAHRLTHPELLPVSVFLELLGARLHAHSLTQPLPA